MGGNGSGTAKGELLRLDGVALIDGKLEKTDFFNFLNADLSDYSNFYITPEEATALKNSVVRLTYGTSAAIPLHCFGEKCFNKLCPFHITKNYPYLKQCVIETQLIKNLTRSYVEDLGVDPNSISEMTLINKMVECDVIDFRANIGLSGSRDQEDGTLLKTVITESDNGMHKEEVNIHPLLEAKDKAAQLKIKILDSFAATRREKYKKQAALKKSEDTDSSQMMSKLAALYGLDSKKSLPPPATKEETINGDWEESDL